MHVSISPPIPPSYPPSLSVRNVAVAEAGAVAETSVAPEEDLEAEAEKEDAPPQSQKEMPAVGTTRTDPVADLLGLTSHLLEESLRLSANFQVP